jgi:hypothetical protein
MVVGRGIVPAVGDRLFGRPATTGAVLKSAIGPMRSRTRSTV